MPIVQCSEQSSSSGNSASSPAATQDCPSTNSSTDITTPSIDMISSENSCHSSFRVSPVREDDNPITQVGRLPRRSRDHEVRGDAGQYHRPRTKERE